MYLDGFVSLSEILFSGSVSKWVCHGLNIKKFSVFD